MDIRKAAVAETSVLHLRDSNDELMFADDNQKKPITITLYGPGSKVHAKARAAKNARMVERMKGGKIKTLSAEAQAEDDARFLSDVTESSENLVYDGLKGRELYMAVYSDLSIGFIADQVAKHLGEWANFTKGSQTTSSATSEQ